MKERSPDVDVLMDAAREAAEKAYAPYSRFQVGAAILTEGGAVHAGCNVENGSFGLTIFAEQNPGTSIVLAGPDDRKIRFVAV